MYKTFDEWTERFKCHEYYDIWKENLTEENRINTQDDKISWRQFISYSFVWAKTKQGHNFWASLAWDMPQLNKKSYYI